MGHKNYTKYSENSEQVVNNEVQVNEADVVNVTPVNEVPEDAEVVENITVVTAPEAPEVPEVPETNINNIPAPNPNHVEGVVVNCTRLNVRAEANKEAAVVGIFSKGTSVMVELENSTDDFYKIDTLGLEGYCMKNFIEIK